MNYIYHLSLQKNIIQTIVYHIVKDTNKKKHSIMFIIWYKGYIK